jgi:hypothetical protein
MADGRLHDFRTGCQYWGHAIHGMTLRQVKPAGLIQRLIDCRRKAVRMSVMVHCSPSPRIGDRMAWTWNGGRDIVAPIIAVDPCVNPRDMFSITVYVTPDCEKASLPGQISNQLPISSAS